MSSPVLSRHTYLFHYSLSTSTN